MLLLGGFAEAAPIDVFIDDQELLMDVNPVIKNDRTLVPLRAIFEAFDASVAWKCETRTVIINKDKVYITLQIENKDAYINDKLIKLDAPPVIKNDRTLVPLRFISESLNKEVDWCDSSKTVFINNIEKETNNKKTNEQEINNKTNINNSETNKENQENALYDKIKKALLNFEEEIDISSFNVTAEEAFFTRQQVLGSHPEIFYYTDIKSSYVSAGNRTLLRFNYIYSESEIKEKQIAFEKKTDKIINKLISPEMSKFEKLLAIHDHIVLNASYDYENYHAGTIPHISRTSYGVLMKGKGVCSGLTFSLQHLLNQVDIESIYVTGYVGESYHGWCMVKIDNNYYHMDITWNNPASNDEVLYRYFNLTDEEMKKTHSWDKDKYPSCTSTKNNYHVKIK